MLKTKRTCLILAVVCLLVGWVYPALAQKATLNFITTTGPRYGFAAKGMAEDFMKANPDVKINVEAFPYGEYTDKIALDVAGGAVYNIIWVDYQFIGGYADAGYLLPLDKYLQKNPEYWKDAQSDIPSNVRSLYLYKDQMFAIPHDGNSSVFYYRQDVLADAGVEVPTTVNQLLASVPKVHNAPIMYGYGSNLKRFWASDFWYNLFFSLGGQVWDEDYTPGINTEAGVKSLDIMGELFKYGSMDALNWAEADVYEAMGTAGIIAMAPFQWAGNVLTNPDAAKLAHLIGVAVNPSVEGKLHPVMGGYGLSVGKRTPHQDEAMDFIMYYTARENQRALVAYTGQPPRISALTDPVNVKIARYFPVLGESIKNAIARPVIAEFAKATRVLGVEINKALLGQKSSREALDDANEAIYNILVQGGRIKG